MFIIFRKKLAKIARRKSVGPDGFSDEILKLGGEAMKTYLAIVIEISLNNATIPREWKIPTVVPIYKRENRSALSNYRPIRLTSLVCKQLEHVIAGYLCQVWDKNNWLYERQNGFRLGYSCEFQVITVCVYIADPLDQGNCRDEFIIEFSKALDLFPHDRLLTKLAATDVDSSGTVRLRKFLYVVHKG